MTPQPPRNRGVADGKILEPNPWSGVREAELVDVERAEGEVRISLKIPAKEITLTVDDIDCDEDI